MCIFISGQYLLLDNKFLHILFLTDYMTVAETVDIVVEYDCIAIQHVLDHMECKTARYFFIILGGDSLVILTVIPSK